jgi:hypothetical protein
MSACVSFDVDTDTTFTAKRLSLAAEDKFALLIRSLKGALFCRREDAY